MIKENTNIKAGSDNLSVQFYAAYQTNAKYFQYSHHTKDLGLLTEVCWQLAIQCLEKTLNQYNLKIHGFGIGNKGSNENREQNKTATNWQVSDWTRLTILQ